MSKTVVVTLKIVIDYQELDYDNSISDEAAILIVIMTAVIMMVTVILDGEENENDKQYYDNVSDNGDVIMMILKSG